MQAKAGQAEAGSPRGHMGVVLFFYCFEPAPKVLIFFSPAGVL